MSAPTLTECSHGMPAPASCIDCMDAGPVAPPTEAVEIADSPLVEARRASTCPVCEDLVSVGDPIVHTTADRWIHEGCLP